MASTIDLKLNAEIKKAAQDFVKFQKEASKSLKGVDKSLKSIKFAALATGLNQGIQLIERLSRSVESAINPFRQYERGLVNIGKTTGLAGAELNRVGDAFRELATQIPVSVEELNEIGTIAGQLGISGAQDLTKFTTVVAQLTKTTVLGADEAASQLAKLFNITGESIQDLDKFSDVLVDLGNNFAADERQILALSSEIARSSSEFNLLSKDIASIAVALKALNQRTEGAGTAIGRTFRAIETAIVKGGASFRELIRLTGLSGRVLRETFAADAFKVFDLFIQGLSKTTGETGKLRESLAKFGLVGQRVLKVLPALVKSNNAFQAAQLRANQQAEVGGATQTEFARILETVDSKIGILKNTVNESAITLGEVFNEEIKNTIDLLTDAAKAAVDFAKSLKGFGEDESDAVKKLTGEITDLINEQIKLQEIIGEVERTGGDASASRRRLRDVQVITDTLLATRRNMLGVSSAAKQFVTELKKAEKVKVTKALDLDALKKQFNEILRFADSVESKTLIGLKKQLDRRINVIDQAVKKDIEGAKKAARARLLIEQEFLRQLKSLRENQVNRGLTGFIIDSKGLEKELSGLRTEIEAKVNVDLVAGALGTVKNVLQGAQGAVQLLSSAIGAIVDIFLPGLGKIIGEIFSILAQGPEAVREMVKSFVLAIPEIIRNVILAGPEIINAFVESLPEFTEKIVTALAEALPEAIAKSAVPFSLKLAAQAPAITKAFAQAFVREVPKMAETFVKALVDEIKGAFTSLGGVFGGGGGGDGIGGIIGGAIGGGFGAIAGGLFAKGGVVPQGFPRDSFPAGLTSGERVLTPRGNNDLENLLTKIANQNESPPDSRELRVTLNIGERELADVLLDLGRQGFRVA